MYQIQKIGDCSNDQLAFLVSYENFKIVVGNSGHWALLKQISSEPVDYPFGGWIFRRKGQVVDSGTLKSIKKDRDEIIEMLKMLFC